MPSDTICKTIRQYNKNAIPKEDMEKLLEIARDYSKVKRMGKPEMRNSSPVFCAHKPSCFAYAREKIYSIDKYRTGV